MMQIQRRTGRSIEKAILRPTRAVRRDCLADGAVDRHSVRPLVHRAPQAAFSSTAEQRRPKSAARGSLGQRIQVPVDFAGSTAPPRGDFARRVEYQLISAVVAEAMLAN